MGNKNRFFEIGIVILFCFSAFFAFQYFTLLNEFQILKSTQAKVEINQKVINFTALFIDKVLKAESEIDFETRLTLENAVRDLKDDEIMAEWQKFTGSQTEAEAQNGVKKLLGILITKIQS